MTTTLTTTPTYALPRPDGTPTRVDVAITGGANFVRLWVTAAPAASRYAARLKRSRTSRLEVYAGAGEAFEAELDRPGVYVFTAQEYTRGASTYGGGYAASPDRVPSETKVGGETTLTIAVGTSLECRIGSPEYGMARLVLHVWDNTIRRTTEELHGVATPAIIQPTNARAATAAEAEAVQEALEALVDATTTSAVGELASLHAELRADIVAHMGNASVHAGADADNAAEIERLPASPSTPAGYARAAAVMRSRLALHMSNGTDGSSIYHEGQPDYQNALAALSPAGPTDMAAVLAAYADLARAYEAHRQETAGTVHGSEDEANALETGVGQLLALHQAFLAALRLMVPPTPATVHAGENRLIHSAGFTRS